MGYGLPDGQRRIRAGARRFAENGSAPVAGEHDREERHSHDSIDTAAEMGMFAPSIPVVYGGTAHLQSRAPSATTPQTAQHCRSPRFLRSLALRPPGTATAIGLPLTQLVFPPTPSPLTCPRLTITSGTIPSWPG
ncbi:hypothetical protein BRC98_04665 [Halobacteriales archaeon QS_7_68_65]|nr:MAG: hypothetical protein BRC98_04665 [Halobacteriales archaeon QS_7_68_65]